MLAQHEIPLRYSSRTVLVVDDSELVRSSLSAFISGHPGMVVSATAANARSAIEMADAMHPDIALLDMNMPGGGTRAATGIHSVWPRTRMLALTVRRDEQIVGFAEPFAVGIGEALEQMRGPLFSAADIIVDDADLIGIGPSIPLHGERLSAPDQLAAALAEVFPAAERVLGGLAGGGAVPSLHGMHAPAISHDEPADIERPRHGRILVRRKRFLIAGDVEAHAAQMRRE